MPSIIVCGYSSTSKEIIARLKELGHEPALITMEEADHDNLFRGDMLSEDLLLRAGIKAADTLVAASEEDTRNVYLCLIARELNPDTYIITVSNSDENVEKLYMAGADFVIPKTAAVGRAIISHTVIKDRGFTGESIRISGVISSSEITIRNKCVLTGRSIKELELKKMGVIIAALKRGRRHHIPPDPDMSLEEKDHIIVVGKVDAVNEFVKKVQRLDGDELISRMYDMI